jgi:hypothetical protein
VLFAGIEEMVGVRRACGGMLDLWSYSLCPVVLHRTDANTDARASCETLDSSHEHSRREDPPVGVNPRPRKSVT